MAVSQVYSTWKLTRAAALHKLRQLDDSILESESVLDVCSQRHHNNRAETVENVGCWKDICSSPHA